MPPTNPVPSQTSTSTSTSSTTSKINIRTATFTSLYTLPLPSLPTPQNPPPIQTLALQIGSDPSLRSLDTLLSSDEGDSLDAGTYASLLVEGVGAALGRAVSGSSSGIGNGNGNGDGVGRRAVVVGGRNPKRPPSTRTNPIASGSGSPRMGSTAATSTSTSTTIGGGVRGVGGRFQSRKVESSQMGVSQGGTGGMAARTLTRKSSMSSIPQIPQIHTDPIEVPLKKRKIEIKFRVCVNIREIFSDEEGEGEGQVEKKKVVVKSPTKSRRKMGMRSVPEVDMDMEVDGNTAPTSISTHPSTNTTQAQEAARAEEGEDSLILKTDGLVLDSGRKKGGGIARVGGKEGEVFLVAKRSVGELDGEVEESPPKRVK